VTSGPRVLVTNAQQRKSLAAIRSLGRHGVRVTAAENTCLAMSFYSRYTDQAVVYPDPETHPEAFLDWLISFLRKEPHDVLFSMDDDVLEVVTQHLVELRRYVIVPVVDRDTYLLASDKLRTVQSAKAAGVRCPKTVSARSLDEVNELAPSLSFPVVIKPRNSSGSRGLIYVFSQKELLQSWKEVDEIFPQPLVQEYISPGGQAIGVSALLDQDSQPYAVFVHRRLREYPVAGGPSALCESIHDQALADLAVRFLQQLKWFGVAMVEFKTNPNDGLPYLLEINPRFWGSLQLAIHCGVDFPWLLYQLAMGNEILPVFHYPAGKRYRWLPGDVLHFLTNRRRWEIAQDFFRIDMPRTCYEVLSRDDWRPTIGLALTLGGQALEAAKNSILSANS